MTTTRTKSFIRRLLDFLFGTSRRIQIQGILIDKATRKPLDHLTIEAWLQTESETILLDKETSDSEGRFCFSSRRTWNEHHHRHVFFRIFASSGNLLHDTQHTHCWTPEHHTRLMVIELDTKSQIVKGKITLESGNPAIHLRVELSRKTLKEEQLLDCATTSASGAYELNYPSTGVPAIIVRVFNPKGTVPVAVSSIISNPRAVEEINLQVEAEKYQSIALYDAIKQWSSQLLGKMDVRDLNESQIGLLAHESGIPIEEVRTYQQTHIRSENHILSAEVFFAILESGREVSEEAVIQLSEETLKHILAQAWEEHIISKERSSQLLQEISAHEAESIRYQLTRTSFSSELSLSDAWQSLNLSESTKERIGALLRRSGGQASIFWKEMEQDQELKALVPKLEFLTGLKNLTLGNRTLIDLFSRNKALRSLEDLAGWSLDKWKQAIGTSTIPEEIKGEQDERIRNYATSMKRMVDYLHPTRSVLVSYITDEANTRTLKEDYALFFKNNPSFLLEKNNLDAYLTKNPEALLGLQNEEAFKKEMGTTIRLFRISPTIDRYESMARLTKMGVNNAQEVTQKGFSSFQFEFTMLGGIYETAQLIYRNAQHYSALANSLLMSFTSDQSIQMYVYNNNIKQDATWKTLFGSEDYCACQHCKSVYSPAAYLADSLRFLENRKKADNTGSMYDVLDARRPDIKHILLNCENANTPMPYIDLVNEVLEVAAIQQGMLSADFVGFQTTRTMDELMANPEHLEEEAYTELKSAKYPWSLPFDFYNRLGKTYLQHLGVKHHKLVRMFPFSETTLPTDPTAEALLIFKEKRNIKATLNLNEIDWDLLKGANYANQERKLWGTSGPISLRVSNILEKTQLSLDDLKILIDTKFVNPTGKLEITYAELCSIEGAQLTNCTQAMRKRMLQLVRLKHKLNTDLRTVDHILNALKAQEINAFTLNNIAQLLRWQETYHLPYSELVTWVGNLPTANRDDAENHRELYEQTFLTNFEGNNESTRGFFALNDSKKQLRNETRTFDQAIRNYISGALQISSSDLDALIAVLPTNKLTLANLSIIYGTFSLARTLHLSVPEVLGLRAIINSGTTERIHESQSIAEARTDLQKSRISVSEVLYLFGKSDEGKMTDQRTLGILQEIREGLWKRDNQGMETDGQTPLTSEDFIVDKLGSALGIDRNVITLLVHPSENGASYLIPSTPNGSTPYMESFLALIDFPSQEAAPIITAGKFPALEELCEKLNKISLLYKKLKFTTEHYRILLTAEGKDKWFDFNRLGNEATYSSLTELLHLNEIVGETGNSEVNLFELMGASSLSETWQINAAKLLAYTDANALMAMSNVLQLDVQSVQNSSGYLSLLSAKALENHLGILITEYTNTQGQFVLAQSVLDQASVLKIVHVAKSKYGQDQWQNVTKQLRDALREEQRDALLAFLTATIKDASGNPLNSPEKLYAHFLLDTEMSACTVTSRIRLALSSVQLFAQRCLMNLELDASLEGISEVEQEEWKEWTWRKNYRVWEANRKVFLYPENWLEPEWRDDKTPFFQELERELQQNELSSENAESAYLNYLYKLESVSNLEIMAMCDAEKVDGVLSGYYIFGRTHGSPKILYFRKYTLEPESFTPWEKVEVDFEGDELVPVVHNNRLSLYWPVFREQSLDQPRTGEGEYGYNDPVKYWEINIAWSEYKNESWSPKLQSSTTNCYSFGKNPVLLYQYINKTKFQLELFINREVKYGAYDELSYLKVGDFISSGRTFLFEAYHPYQPSPDAILNGAVPETHKQIKRVLTKKDILINETAAPEKHRIILPSNNSLSSYLIQCDTKSAIVYNKESLKHLLLLNFPVVSEIIDRTIYSGLGKIINENNELNEAFLNNFSRWTFDFEDIENSFFSYAVQNSFSQYNWELFFHIPMYVANKLRQDQKFAEAQKWFHYVFDPTSSDPTNAPKKFWVFQPFRDYVCSGEDGTPCNIQELMRMLNEESETPEFQALEQTVHAWERSPFSPHTVARTRIIAYMKWVVMRYIDTLIEWADQLFRRDSIESLNEATQLYMLAWNILGEAPHAVTAKEREDESYNDLRGKLDEFSNALVALMDRIPTPSANQNQGTSVSMMSALAPQIELEDRTLIEPKVPQLINQGQENLLPANMLYFCIPQNEKLLGYWDLVRDRFFKLRHCLNIEGVYRQLPLYEPPIDPALLIQAKANGLSIADALSAAYAPKSHYRFLLLLQKAVDYANDVRVFGGALLSALEKRDAEEMVALRSVHEVQLLHEVTLVRKEQIKELRLSNQSLDYSMANIENRRAYFAEKEFMSSEEKSQQNMLRLANTYQILGQSLSLLAAATRPIPDVTAGYSGLGGHLVTNVGGEKAAASIDLMAQAYSMFSGIAQIDAASSGQTAAYNRRSEDWKFQASTAEIEIKQLEKQILAAQIRMSIAQQELKNHELQVENSTKQLELVQTKFTSYELYDWMVGQLKTLYFQSYQMAFDMAKKAESALLHEHGIGSNTSETFIKFGYWDNLKEGLLSGEKLHHDLKRMEMIYMQRNERRHEVSKTVSLAMIDAEELGRLRATGKCCLSIPEILFDLDFPQHADRMIKSVSITIPAVTGPYTGVNAVLSTANFGSIAVTGSQNDAGLFQFNFNDERYLPFEGMRFEAVDASPSKVSFDLQMNDELRSFDYNTITDVLLHIHYTADDLPLDKDQLAEKVEGLRAKLVNNKFTQLISVKNEFSHEWFEGKSSESTSLSLPRNKIRTPYFLRNENLSLSAKYAKVDATGKLILASPADWIVADLAAETIQLNGLNFEDLSDLFLAIQLGTGESTDHD